MVHRPHRLIDVISAMRQHRLEPKRIRFVHPYEDREANMVLLEAVKDGRPFLKTERPLIVYKSAGEYTDEVKKLYYG